RQRPLFSLPAGDEDATPPANVDTTSIRYSGQAQSLTGSTLTPDFVPMNFALGAWGEQRAVASYAEVLVD
ncbi:MAG: hypothetical protein GXP62_15400, partial [Oligoflexia bacterium]|nr:hypothetical protein [Oligoflexia bacterium]